MIATTQRGFIDFSTVAVTAVNRRIETDIGIIMMTMSTRNTVPIVVIDGNKIHSPMNRRRNSRSKSRINVRGLHDSGSHSPDPIGEDNSNDNAT